MPSLPLMQEENCWTTVRVISYWENLPGLKLHPLLLEVVKLGLHAPVKGMLSLTKRLRAERVHLAPSREPGRISPFYSWGAEMQVTREPRTSREQLDLTMCLVLEMTEWFSLQLFVSE